MLYLILSVLFSASLLFIFKFYQKFNIHTFQAIVVNYVVCILVGLAFPEGKEVLQPGILSQSWAPYATALGTIFIATFYLMALTTQKVGVTAASVAAKISLVIPVLFSLLVLKTSLKEYTWLNYAGMAAALVAIVLSSLRPKSSTGSRTPLAVAVVLPFIIFLNSGLADSLINYANQYHMQPQHASQFTMLTFTTSAMVGLLVLLYQLLYMKKRFQLKSVVAGVVLGVPNYFTIFFLVMALSAFNNDGAFFYPINNIGIILVGALGAVLFFKEKLSSLNLIGIGMAILALVLISYQEIAANLF